MARDFNGTNENIQFGSDASIDDFVTQSFSFWFRKDTTNADDIFCKENAAGGTTGWKIFVLGTGGSERLRFRSQWTTTDGVWTATTSTVAGTLYHIAVVYSNSATTNDPTIYVDGTAEALSIDTNPTGSYTLDGADTMFLGEAASGASDFDGAIGWLVYANATWTADQVNRARWWGTPGGAVAIYHPFLTDKLTNEGTATANGTATGTTVTSLPRVERCWGSMMGCGR